MFFDGKITLFVVCLVLLVVAGLCEAKAIAFSPSPEEDQIAMTSDIETIRLTWEAIPGAVQYELTLFNNEEDNEENIVEKYSKIFNHGITIDVTDFGKDIEGYYWKIQAQDASGNYLGKASTPALIGESAEFNPTSPLPTTEFEQMAYMPLYPVFEWIPLSEGSRYQIQVYYNDELMRYIEAEGSDFYETVAYTKTGDYYWRIRALSSEETPIGEWSLPSYFTIESPTPIAALGDSITHGGGVISVSAGETLYDWETYSSLPIKNLGYSGDTTAAMLARFEKDVLPWQPRILIIMGGVNDFRLSTPSDETIDNLAAIGDKCNEYGIIPVFVTATSINPELMMRRIAGCEVSQPDWYEHFLRINDWVRKQKYHIDVATRLLDESGRLDAIYTTDGLHPDFEGKKYIGETISKYLRAYMTEMLEEK